MKDLEKKRIRKYYKELDLENIEDAKEGQAFSSLIVIVTKEMHDSGYPCIEIFGISEDGNKLFNLGRYHDHFLAKCPINVDAFGKNVFHIMPWNGNRKFIAKTPLFCTTFEITENYELR